MAFKGSKLNLPYFLFKSLQKMAIVVQSTIAEQDRSLFHHGLVKILVQYQLYFINVTWYQFLSKTSFGQNEEWPSVRPTTQPKRRRSSRSKVFEENIEQNLKDSKDDSPFQSVVLENRFMEEKSQPDKVEISSNEQLVHRNPILDKGFGESIQGITVNSVCVDQIEPKLKNPIHQVFVGSHIARFFYHPYL